MILKEVDSGTIDIVFENGETLLQFNCDCLDALPWCNAMCCRGRPEFNVGVTKEEQDDYDTIEEKGFDLPLLNHTEGRCVYLNDKNNLCKIHDVKPHTCKVWHCSPSGGGDDIKLRSNGWKLRIGKLTGEDTNANGN